MVGEMLRIGADWFVYLACERNAAGQVDLDVEMLARCARPAMHALRALVTDWFVYVGGLCTLDRTAI